MSENRAKHFRTSEIAAIIGVHPNTVRLYESLGFLTPPRRLPNGYRVYTDLHLAQLRFARTAMRAEVLQNGLRKQAVEIVKLCAAQDYGAALAQTDIYEAMIEKEIERAQTAAAAVVQIRQRRTGGAAPILTRKQAAEALGVTTDALRNWELNGLMKIKRRKNGYRVYNAADLEQLSIIRTLRCANYSLSAILRLMNHLAAADSGASVTEILNTPSPDEEIISVCDRLGVSLAQTRADAQSMRAQLTALRAIKPST